MYMNVFLEILLGVRRWGQTKPGPIVHPLVLLPPAKKPEAPSQNSWAPLNSFFKKTIR